MAYKGSKNYTKEELVSLAQASHSKRQLLIALDLPISGSYGYRTLNYFLDLYAVDISHFQGRERASINAVRAAIPLSDIFAGKHPQYQGCNLKIRAIRAGILEAKCSECGLTEWRGKPVPLDLDHINGRPWDHKRDNIRLLCRNCHAQTENFCGRNTRGAIDRAKAIAEKTVARQKREDREYAFVSDVINSGIDFSRFGWVKEVSPIIGRAPQKVAAWMTKYMPDFYSQCFRASRPGRGNGSIKKSVGRTKAERDVDRDNLISQVRTSGIDFSQKGWVTKVAQLTGKRINKVNPWVKRFLPDVYETCFLKPRS